MIVDKTGALHESVANGGADKSEPALFEIARQSIGFATGGGNLAGVAMFMNDRLVTNKCPEIFRKRAKFFLNLEESRRVFDCAFNFQTIWDDALIFNQPIDFPRAEARDFLRIKISKRFRERRSLV